jgi:hypothetical protein
MFNLDTKPDKDYEICAEWNLLFIDVSANPILTSDFSSKKPGCRTKRYL